MGQSCGNACGCNEPGEFAMTGQGEVSLSENNKGNSDAKAKAGHNSRGSMGSIQTYNPPKPDPHYTGEVKHN